MSKSHAWGHLMRRLPPLNALRAFEASARNTSFTRAAQELCVTQGAVSRHVGTLEDWLKITLFERGRSGLAITAPGAVYFRTITRAQIGGATLRDRGDAFVYISEVAVV